MISEKNQASFHMCLEELTAYKTKYKTVYFLFYLKIRKVNYFSNSCLNV